jgi:hypothetical protein
MKEAFTTTFAGLGFVISDNQASGGVDGGGFEDRGMRKYAAAMTRTPTAAAAYHLL